MARRQLLLTRPSYRALAGEHPDWEEFRAAMVEEERLPLHLHVERLYGIPPR